jgi:hypothetical protein
MLSSMLCDGLFTIFIYICFASMAASIEIPEEDV